MVTDRFLLSVLGYFLIVNVGFTQADYDLGGASRPRPQRKLTVEEKQYKRIHQYALRLILGSEMKKAGIFLKGHIELNPEDPESPYLLGVLYARMGKKDEAVESLRKSLSLGLMPDRLLAGPRDLFANLQDHPFFKELRNLQKNNPLHGPLIGNVTDHSASFWFRTLNESDLKVILSEQADFSHPLSSGSSSSSRHADYTGVVEAVGLKPSTRYYFKLVVDGKEVIEKTPIRSFKTFPQEGKSCSFRMAFGGGAGYVPPHERMWNTIGSFDPLVMLLLGDNVYIDDPESVIMQQYTYQRRQSRPEWRGLTGRVPVFCIYDDHDFSTNDSWGGPSIDIPFWKKDYSWKIFRENWANPGYGGGLEQPGCWYSFSIGDVDFIMLDCRYYRENPEGENPSMLGPVQMEWFKKELAQSEGVFKVICSSVPWDFRTKGNSLDTWNGYQREREVIFSFIESRKTKGVLLMSADRHRSDAWKIERNNGYGFYEFNSSRLTNQHVHPEMVDKGAIFSYNKKQSFGLIDFDTTLQDPEVSYSVVNIDGEIMHSLTVKKSLLQY